MKTGIRSKHGINHSSTPSIELTTMVGCPLMCTFCPQENLRENYGDSAKYLSVENLKLYLEKIPQHVRIDFSGMAEPWANPSCSEMLELVLTKGFKVAIYTTLYGMSKPDYVAELLKKYVEQVEIVCIHLPDNNGNMKGWKFSQEWLTAFNILNSLQLNCKVEKMTMDKNGIPSSEIQHLLSDTLPPFDGHTRANSLDTNQIKSQPIRHAPHHDYPLTCAATPFYDKNVLLPNGDVVLCCMDYNLTTILGNLNTDKYEDLYNNPTYKNLLSINESNEFSKCSICKSCDSVIRLQRSGVNELKVKGIRRRFFYKLSPFIPSFVSRIRKSFS